MKSCGFITETWGGMYGGSLSQDGNRGMPREQREHGDKGAGDERKGEDTCRERKTEAYMKVEVRKECVQVKSNNNISAVLPTY